MRGGLLQKNIFIKQKHFGVFVSRTQGLTLELTLHIRKN